MKEMSCGKVVDGAVAEDLGPMVGEGGGGCSRVNIMKRALGVHDVRDRDFGTPGGPEDDPGLQPGLVLAGGGMVPKGAQRAVGGGDGGFDQ